jgi:nicotinamidase-related amidase
VGIALEIGVEPTARRAADLGFIPVVVTEASGFGNDEAARRSVNALEFAGDTIFTDIETLRRLLQSR